MNSNFREALVKLSRALPAVIFRAGIFIAGGFLVIIFFAMLLIALRLAGGVSQSVIIAVLVLAVLGGWGCGRVLQRFFLFRHRAALLLLFPIVPPWLPASPQPSKRSDDFSRIIPAGRSLSATCAGPYQLFIAAKGISLQDLPRIQADPFREPWTGW